MIDPKEFELTCFSLKEATFNPSKIDFFVGTATGKLFYFYNGWFNNEKELIHNDKDEGPITNVLCYNDLVAWSTSTKIRLIHYSKRQKICLIERPKRYPTFPEYLYQSTATTPTFNWKKDRNTGQELFEVVWLNLIKICRLRLMEDQKYKMEVVRK